jgi:hypothetical protein
MKSPRMVETTVFGLVILALLWVGHIGCKKTESPFGAYAPNGVDVPTPTPTPVSGSIEVYVNDNATPKMGVTVLLIDPLGNTLNTASPITTQPNVYYAAFNPPNLINGTWKACVPTQGKYFNSYQGFTVNGGSSYTVTFTAANESLSASGFSSTFPLVSLGTSYTVTLGYNQPNNLSVPVSVYPLSLPGAFVASPSTFVMGSGVSVLPVTFTKSACYPVDLPVTFLEVDFLDNVLTPSNPSTLLRSFSVPLTVTASIGNDTVGNDGWEIGYSLNAASDCGTNYTINGNFNEPVIGTGGTNSQTFSLSSGQAVSWANNAGENAVVYCYEQPITLTTILTLPNGNPITIQNDWPKGTCGSCSGSLFGGWSGNIAVTAY